MRTKHFETCEELGCPQLIYIRDVRWAETHWEELIAFPGVITKQKPHFIVIENPNDRLLFLMKWGNKLN